jgi:preprotein translocase subunit SecG
MMRFFSILHAALAALFACAALVLTVLAVHQAWLGVATGLGQAAAQQVIEAIGYLAGAVVALQIAQTIVEEEVIRGAHVSGPTRVRRFLSRFMVVLIVAFSIEGLVATFRTVHDNVSQLPAAASIVFAAGALLGAWGVFVRLNRSAEELEPEAMEKAKREDRKLEQ